MIHGSLLATSSRKTIPEPWSFYQPGNLGTTVLMTQLSGTDLLFAPADGFTSEFPIGAVQTLPDPDRQDLLLVINETFGIGMVYSLMAPGVDQTPGRNLSPIRHLHHGCRPGRRGWFHALQRAERRRTIDGLHAIQLRWL